MSYLYRKYHKIKKQIFFNSSLISKKKINNIFLGGYYDDNFNYVQGEGSNVVKGCYESENAGRNYYDDEFDDNDDYDAGKNYFGNQKFKIYFY